LCSPLFYELYSKEDPDFVPEDVEYVAALHPNRARDFRVSPESFHGVVL
jgi:hypothetical protein